MEGTSASDVVVADSVTKLPACRGRVVIAGSHGGIYAAYLACKAGVRGIVLSDAGRGRDDAGIGGGAYCDALGVPYAAVDTMSARIGDGADMAARGRISHANEAARALGVAPGMTAGEAARRMREAPLADRPPPPYEEARRELPAEARRRRIVLVDSASLVRPEDAGRIVVTGSHGGMPGPSPGHALAVDAFAALFNDAGGGIDGAGITRLPVLDGRGIAAATVAASSARIGDGRSTYEDGVLSHVNRLAAALGGKAGMPARDFVARAAEAG